MTGKGDEIRCNDCENDGILRGRGLIEGCVEIPIIRNAAAPQSGLQSPVLIRAVLSFRTSTPLKSVIDFNPHWFSSDAYFFKTDPLFLNIAMHWFIDNPQSLRVYIAF